MQQIVFRSKVDNWLVAVIILSVLISLATISVTVKLAPAFLGVTLVLVVLTGAILPLWLTRSTRYCLDDSTLLIQSGPFTWNVPINEIRNVEPTRNPLSSPALSLDRLRIEYGQGKWIMISPDDKPSFLRELKLRQNSQN
jgi:membrane protein YdbS with pleckstrin-like domain